MKWYSYDVIMLVAFAALLVNCVSFLAFGWRFPGSFRRPEGARLRGWAGVCLGTGTLIVVFTDVVGNAYSDDSRSPAWMAWLLIFVLVGYVAAFVLVGMAVRVMLRTQRGGLHARPADGIDQAAGHRHLRPGARGRLQKLKGQHS